MLRAPGEPFPTVRFTTLRATGERLLPPLSLDGDPAPPWRVSGLPSDLFLAFGGGGGSGIFEAAELLAGLGAGGVSGALGGGSLALSTFFLSSGLSFSFVAGGHLLVAILLSFRGELRLRF